MTTEQHPGAEQQPEGEATASRRKFITQAAAATRLGLSERSFRRRETGEGQFTAAELFAYARQLGLRVALSPVAPASSTETEVPTVDARWGLCFFCAFESNLRNTRRSLR